MTTRMQATKTLNGVSMTDGSRPDQTPAFLDAMFAEPCFQFVPWPDFVGTFCAGGEL